MKHIACPLCHFSAIRGPQEPQDALEISCAICGVYFITFGARKLVGSLTTEHLHALSQRTKAHSDGGHPITISEREITGGS